jgi:hypothetical protein
MSKATTIKLDPEVKDALDRENLDGETFSETVARLLGETSGTTWTEEEIRQIAIRAVEDERRKRA